MPPELEDHASPTTAHVPEGPGGMCSIGHGADYFMDEGAGRLGLLHNRKRVGVAEGERLSDLARRTLHAASLLEEGPALRRHKSVRDGRAAVFRRERRLAAPNTDATFAALEGELEALGERLFAGFLRASARGRPQGAVLGALQERGERPPRDAARTRRRRPCGRRLARELSVRARRRAQTRPASECRGDHSTPPAISGTLPACASLLASWVP